jgi:hypothetical protein
LFGFDPIPQLGDGQVRTSCNLCQHAGPHSFTQTAHYPMARLRAARRAAGAQTQAPQVANIVGTDAKTQRQCAAASFASRLCRRDAHPKIV